MSVVNLRASVLKEYLRSTPGPIRRQHVENIVRNFRAVRLVQV